jgi:hypothetical protein
MTDINTHLLRVLRDEINASLAAVASKHGITLEVTKGTYGHTFGSFKLEIGQAVAAGVDPLLVTREAEAFKVNAKVMGFVPEDLGREFSQGGQKWRIIGIKPRARTRPMLIENLATKKVHVCEERFIPFYTDPYAAMRASSKLSLTGVTAGATATRSEKMQVIRTYWDGANNADIKRLWSLSDGYGEQGFMPSQGLDWSGVRDSSDAAVDAMYEFVRGSIGV